MSDQEQINEAIQAHIEKHGTVPKVVMLGETIWRERADRICGDMNRTGPGSEVTIHRLPKGCEGVVCA